MTARIGRRTRHRRHKASTKVNARLRRAIAKAWRGECHLRVVEKEVAYRSLCVGGPNDGMEIERGQRQVSAYEAPGLGDYAWGKVPEQQLVNVITYERMRLVFTEEVERTAPVVMCSIIDGNHEAILVEEIRRFVGRLDLWLAPSEDAAAVKAHWGRSLRDMVRLAVRYYVGGRPK